MNGNNQLYQSPEQRSNAKSIIKTLLLIIIGIIIGAGVISIFYFLRLETTVGINQKTQQEILANFKDDLIKGFSTVFGKDTIIEIYIMEKEEDTIGVSTTINLSDEQFKEIFGAEYLEEDDLEQLKGLVIIAQAEYIKKEGEWVLKEEPKIYQGIDLVLMQKSLGTAQEKARDASIKADLSMMRAFAEMWWDYDESYEGFCGGADAQESIANIAKSGKIALCGDTATTWAAFSPLYDTVAQCWCVDYRGTSKPLNTPCPRTAVSVCP